jgi:hypothetical protein
MVREDNQPARFDAHFQTRRASARKAGQGVHEFVRLLQVDREIEQQIAFGADPVLQLVSGTGAAVEEMFVGAAADDVVGLEQAVGGVTQGDALALGRAKRAPRPGGNRFSGGGAAKGR